MKHMGYNKKKRPKDHIFLSPFNLARAACNVCFLSSCWPCFPPNCYPRICFCSIFSSSGVFGLPFLIVFAGTVARLIQPKLVSIWSNRYSLPIHSENTFSWNDPKMGNIPYGYNMDAHQNVTQLKQTTTTTPTMKTNGTKIVQKHFSRFSSLFFVTRIRCCCCCFFVAWLVELSLLLLFTNRAKAKFHLQSDFM